MGTTALTLGDGARSGVEQAALIGRVVALAVADPSVELRVDAIAKELQLSPNKVRELLSSEDFEDLVRAVVKRKAGAILGRGLDSMVQIMEGTSERTSDKISAFKAVASVYQVVAQSEAKHDRISKESEALELLETIKGKKLGVSFDGSSS